MYRPISTVFIYTFLKSAYKSGDKLIFRRLCLTSTGGGRRFKGGEGGKCWWPRPEEWFDRYEDEVSKENAYVLEQPFPGDADKESGKQRMTFASCLFGVLQRAFREVYYNEIAKVKYELAKCGAKYGLSSSTLKAMGARKDLDSLARFLVSQAMIAQHSPLEYEDDYEDWRFLRTDELPFGAAEVARQIRINDSVLYDPLPANSQGDQEQLTELFTAYAKHCTFLLGPAGDIQGNYSLVGLSAAQESAMQNGCLVDSEINIADCNPLTEPGEYAMYLMNLSINAGVPIDYYYQLWEHFLRYLLDRAKKGIYFSRIYYKAFLPDHATRVLGRGFTYLCEDQIYGAIYVLNMDDDTTLRIMDEKLASLYRAYRVQGGKKQGMVRLAKRMDAESAFQLLFRQIDEIFMDVRFYELKPYFFEEGMGLPEDEELRQLGTAVAELLRDILQYTEAFLVFLPVHKRISYREAAGRILRSDLVALSREGYCFTTEKIGAKKANYSAISPRSIFHFAQTWIDLDKLALRPELLEIRPWFYERRNELPPEKYLERAIGFAVRCLSAMKAAENLMHNVPDYFVRSYYDYKKNFAASAVCAETLRRYPFLKDELQI